MKTPLCLKYGTAHDYGSFKPIYDFVISFCATFKQKCFSAGCSIFQYGVAHFIVMYHIFIQISSNLVWVL